MESQNIDTVFNTLVYEYLRTHKNSNIRKLAEKLKTQVPIQVEGEILLFEDVFKHKFDMDRQKIDKQLTNTLVYEYLRTHKNSNIQELAQKLKTLVPIQVENENLSIEEVIYHSNVSRQILVPVKKILPKQLVSQAEKQTSQKLVGKVSVKSVKSNEVLVPTQTIGPAEKVMPIKEVYKTLKKSEIKIKGKTEVFKALKLKEIRCDTVEPLSATIVSLLYRSEYSVNIGPEVLNPLYIPCYVQGSCDGRNAGEAAVSVLSNATSRKELNINKTYLHSSISCRLSKKQCLSTGNGDCLLMYIFFFCNDSNGCNNKAKYIYFIS